MKPFSFIGPQWVDENCGKCCGQQKTPAAGQRIDVGEEVVDSIHCAVPSLCLTLQEAAPEKHLISTAERGRTNSDDVPVAKSDTGTLAETKTNGGTATASTTSWGAAEAQKHAVSIDFLADSRNCARIEADSRNGACIETILAKAETISNAV
eukprot:5357349-Amphidinium_carterae.1